MKTLFFSIIALLIFSGCNDDDNSSAPARSGVLGTWALAEILADPGDGSGVFEPVSSDKVVTFFPDGIIESNGLLCILDIETMVSEQGEYSLADSTITGPSCANFPWSVLFGISGNELIFYYPCIEACQAKFVWVGPIE